MYYIQTHQDKKCSKCSSMNNFEYVTDNVSQKIRCKSCGHEKVYAEFRTNLQPSDTSTMSIQMNQVPRVDVF